MLSFFGIKSTFYKCRVSLTVDVDGKAADLCVTYGGRIIRLESVTFRDVENVDKANAWLRRDMGERGNFVEYCEYACRVGLWDNPVATNRPGDMAAVYAAENGVDYSAALVHCNMD